eukprot:3641537-Rhodomonas_salina.1
MKVGSHSVMLTFVDMHFRVLCCFSLLLEQMSVYTDIYHAVQQAKTGSSAREGAACSAKASLDNENYDKACRCISACIRWSTFLMNSLSTFDFNKADSADQQSRVSRPGFKTADASLSLDLSFSRFSSVLQRGAEGDERVHAPASPVLHFTVLGTDGGYGATECA